ncbi:MAG: type II toxin-antitoxin system VapC family toxin [Gaiellaceae bacterium]
MASNLLYADSSALLKLVVREPESGALARAIQEDATLATSGIARVEMTRAIRLADLEAETEIELEELLDSCSLVAVDEAILRSAAALASQSLRALDAIHLASALAIQPDAMLVYDRRLAGAASEAGLRVEAPGATL